MHDHDHSDAYADLLIRVRTLAETRAMALGLSPLLDHEVALIESGALFTLIALKEMNHEPS